MASYETELKFCIEDQRETFYNSDWAVFYLQNATETNHIRDMQRAYECAALYNQNYARLLHAVMEARLIRLVNWKDIKCGS